MKLSFKHSLAILATLMCTSSAFAGGAYSVDVEPYINFGFMKSGRSDAVPAISFPADPNGRQDVSYNSAGAGLRLNLNFWDFFFIGPDFTYNAIFNTKFHNHVEGGGTSGRDYQLGLVAGFHLSSSIRVWAGYSFISEMSTGMTLNADMGNPPTQYTYGLKGTAWKVGGSYTVLSNLDIRGEYVWNTYPHMWLGTPSGAPFVPGVPSGADIPDARFGAQQFTLSLSSRFTLL